MRSIIQVPDPILYRVSEPVKNIDGYVKELAGEMIAVMSDPNMRYAGLAAVQMGELVRMIVIMWNIFSPDFRAPAIILNPELKPKSEKMVDSEEGCLSIKHGKETYIVKRYKLVKVTGMDLNCTRVTYKERGIPGFILQHEIDHLDGKLISGGELLRS